jgi:hypothetical protein
MWHIVNTLISSSIIFAVINEMAGEGFDDERLDMWQK